MSLEVIQCIECKTEIQIMLGFMGDYVPSCSNRKCPNFDKQGTQYFKKKEFEELNESS